MRWEVVVLAVAVVAETCGGQSAGGKEGGAEGTACYPNGSCNEGLTCASGLCVSLPGGDVVAKDGAGGDMVSDAEYPSDGALGAGETVKFDAAASGNADNLLVAPELGAAAPDQQADGADGGGWADGSPAPTGTACEPCKGASDCYDGNLCTEDLCVQGACVHKQMAPNACGCGTDADCDDGNSCTKDLCCNKPGLQGCPWAASGASFTCIHDILQPSATSCCSQSKDCDDGNPLTMDSCCDPGSYYGCDAGKCYHQLQNGCLFDADCDDGNACTEDTCGGTQVGSQSCGHTGKGQWKCCEDDWQCKTPETCDTATLTCEMKYICPSGYMCSNTQICELCPGGVCKSEPCVPDCFNKECGGGGCSGDTCGLCPPTQSCSAEGKCVEGQWCTPSCAGKECGDDGCGGSCGSCDGKGGTCNGIVFTPKSCVTGQCTGQGAPVNCDDLCSPYNPNNCQTELHGCNPAVGCTCGSSTSCTSTPSQPTVCCSALDPACKEAGCIPDCSKPPYAPDLTKLCYGDPYESGFAHYFCGHNCCTDADCAQSGKKCNGGYCW